MNFLITKAALVVFILFPLISAAQSDLPINKYNSHGKKGGYWIQFLDEKLCPVDSSKAIHWGYERFVNGKKRKPIFKSYHWKKNLTVQYEKDSTQNDTSLLLNGIISFYNKDGEVKSKEIFKNGLCIYQGEYWYNKHDKTKVSSSNIYYDRLYYYTVGSFYYEIVLEDGKILQKGYYRLKGNRWRAVAIPNN